MKARWLQRSIVVSPVFYTICSSERIMRAELKRLKVKDQFSHVSDGYDGTTHTLKFDNGKTCCIVCLYNWREATAESVYALIVHEAMHVWQKIRREMNEDMPSDEFEAYSVQTIVQQLMEEFNRQTKNYFLKARSKS